MIVTSEEKKIVVWTVCRCILSHNLHAQWILTGLAGNYFGLPHCGICLRNFAFKHFPAVYLKHLCISCFLNGFTIL